MKVFGIEASWLAGWVAIINRLIVTKIRCMLAMELALPYTLTHSQSHLCPHSLFLMICSTKLLWTDTGDRNQLGWLTWWRPPARTGNHLRFRALSTSTQQVRWESYFSHLRLSPVKSRSFMLLLQPPPGCFHHFCMVFCVLPAHQEGFFPRFFRLRQQFLMLWH